MSTKKLTVLTLVCLCLIFMISTASSDGFKTRVLPEKPEKAIIQPGYSHQHISVKFLDKLSVGINPEGYPYDREGITLKSSRAVTTLKSLTEAGVSWKRMTGEQEQKIEEMIKTAEEYHNREIANLNNYFVIKVPDGMLAEEVIDQLNALDEVEIARPHPLPMKLPFWSHYVTYQGYLNAATDGIGAKLAWLKGGGKGMMVTVCDFEYSWNLQHYDFDTAMTNYATIFPVGYTYSDPYNDKRHGTAVLGELISESGYLGVTGACNDVQIKVAPTYLDDGVSGPAWLLGTAMSNAMTMGGVWRGDVMLIEQQLAGPNWNQSNPTDTGLVPIEWYEPWYNVVLTAIGNGIHVVECAGNGYQNLDDAVYNTGHAPFNLANHSGAIIVGAGHVPGSFGGTDVDRSRMDYSNYGSRLDLQGWGEKVVTTGYGTYYNEWPDSNWDYTNTFSGTSSAAPNVAAAVALVESIYQWNDPMGMGTPFGVDTVRKILINTGSPQQSGTNPATEHIGPRPDLAAAIPVFSDTDTCTYYKAGYTDYSPSGVPDFDQRQNTNWQLPDLRWTHDGPIALANCLWWFDSKYETSGTAPPTIADNYPLVQAYKAGIDDHDTSNVIPLVDSLATYCATNFAPEGPGTGYNFLEGGLNNWLISRGLIDSFTFRSIDITEWDSIVTVKDEVLNSQNVILLLGFWQNVPGVGWTRIGGHYVTLAGVCETRSAFCISDPYFDMVEGEPYIYPPNFPPHADNVHNDASLVSGPHGTHHHDRYDVSLFYGPGVPFVVEMLGYPMDYPDILWFQDMNPGLPFIPPHAYIGMSMVTLIEKALVICPAGGGNCCIGMVGNVDCSAVEEPDISDITRLIDYLYISHSPLCCLPEADADVSGGEPDISDITRLIDYLYISHAPLMPCP